MSKKYTVKVYTPLMRYEKVLFAIGDMMLPFPVTYRQIGFFFTSLALMVLLIKLPILNMFKDWWLINYFAIPVGLTWFFTKFKLDGKNPHRYLIDLYLFKTSKGIYNRYEKAMEPDQYKYISKITFRKGDGEE